MMASSATSASSKPQSDTGFLYGWLLVALFVEYARPTNQLKWLEFPFFYSLVPMALLAATVIAPGLRPLQEIFADRMSKWVMGLFAIILVSYAATGFDANASLVFQSVLGYLFLFILIARIVTSKRRFWGVIVTLLVAHLYLLAMNLQVLTEPSERHYIVGGTFLGDGNDFSLSLCILFPCTVGVALAAKSRFAKGLAWCGATIVILAIVASQSRGGTLGIAAVLIYLWLRSSKKIVPIIGIGIVGVLVLIYAPPAYFERIGTVSSMSIDGSAQGRLDAWGGAIGMGVKNPVLGIGAGQFAARWGKTAHSTYMLAFAELGFPGFLAVLMLVLGNLRDNRLRRSQVLAAKAARPAGDANSDVLVLDSASAGMVGFAVAGAFLSAIYYPHLYVLTALLVSARLVVARSAGIPLSLHKDKKVPKRRPGRPNVSEPKVVEGVD